MKYNIGDKIKLKRNVYSTRNFVVNYNIQQASEKGTILTIARIKLDASKKDCFGVKEMPSGTFIDMQWIDTSFNTKLPEELFEL